MGIFLVYIVCSATSWVDFWSISCRQVCSVLGQFLATFHHVLGKFTVGRGCSAASQVKFRAEEGVPPCPRWNSSWQNVFCHGLGRFLIGRVCSAMSWVDFRSTECVPPCPGSICNNFCSIHCHILGPFPVGRVCSAMYWGNFVALWHNGCVHLPIVLIDSIRHLL